MHALELIIKVRVYDYIVSNSSLTNLKLHPNINHFAKAFQSILRQATMECPPLTEVRSLHYAIKMHHVHGKI